MTNSEAHITWREMVKRTQDEVGERNIAQWLCEHASGCDADEFGDILGDLVSERSAQHLQSMLARYAKGEPLQYVMGRWAFRRLDLLVDSRVLIPRPETELLVEHVTRYALQKIRDVGRGVTIADLGTGSGAVGLSVLHELPFESSEVWMTDVSEDALHVARANAAGVGRNAVGARFGHGSWYEALPVDLQGSLDAIVSNPPYIATGDPLVGESVLKWEPHNALFAGKDGLNDLRVVVSGAPDWLVPGGLLAVEMGFTQATVVSQLFESVGFKNVSVHKDLAGLDRFVTGTSPR
ncbi:MAG: peptide chain release factor N(5)-glutamine methyltransferase [Ilumatobacteraceae bacterium]|jgi:release factor glutamine methyltransferase|nr:peptide chain release factor N(5)-glutamine methyltransferase [Ilumatobacteraceae bacterium]